jgi:hypothetical protein
MSDPEKKEKLITLLDEIPVSGAYEAAKLATQVLQILQESSSAHRPAVALNAAPKAERHEENAEAGS